MINDYLTKLLSLKCICYNCLHWRKYPWICSLTNKEVNIFKSCENNNASKSYPDLIRHENKYGQTFSLENYIKLGICI